MESTNSNQVQDEVVAVDPAIHLNDELMFHIFSFVGGKTMAMGDKGKECVNSKKRKASDPVEAAEEEEEASIDSLIASAMKDIPSKNEQTKDLFCVKEAGRYYMSLALVSVGWKQILDKSISKLIAVPLNADLTVISDDQDRSKCISFLCEHHLSIGYINEGDTMNPRLPTILKQCDTTSLLSITFTLVFPGIDMLRAGGSKAVDLLGYDTAIKWVRAVQDLIAHQCPRLDRLTLRLVLDVKLDGKFLLANGISSDLFSLDTVSFLDILIEFIDGAEGQAPNTNNLLSSMISHFPNLRYLHLKCPKPAWQGIIHVESTSLRQLIVTTFTENASFSLNCPCLRGFWFEGPIPRAPTIPQAPINTSTVLQRVLHAESLRPDCLAIGSTGSGAEDEIWYGRLASVFNL